MDRWAGPYVTLVALHSLCIGVVLTFWPQVALRLGGWDQTTVLFFVRQGGVFHLLMASAYLLEFRRRGRLELMILAKCLATVFLLTTALTGSAPVAVLLSGVADGLMAVGALILNRGLRSVGD